MSVKFEVCTTKKQIKAACAFLRTQSRIAVDTETTGLHSIRSRIILIPVSAGTKHFIFPLRLKTLPNADIDTVRRYLNPILWSKTTRKSLWNCKYDKHMFANDGFRLRNTDDWMVAAWLFDENRPKSLKERCKDVDLDLEKFPFSEYFRLRGSCERTEASGGVREVPGKKPLRREHKEAVDWHVAVHNWSVSRDKFKEWKKEVKPLTPAAEVRLRELESSMLGYAYEDTLATQELGKKYIRDFKSEPVLASIYEKTWNPYVDVLFRIERRGMCINIPYLKKIQKKCKAARAAAEQVVFALAGKAIDINSNKKLTDLLFNEMGIPIMRQSRKTGKPSADHDSLELLSRIPKERSSPYGTDGFKPKYPITKALIEFRKYDKLWGTYLSPDSGMVKSIEKGRIHTGYNPVGTDTGRLSSSGPNLQNLPRSGPDNFYIRKLFIPPRGKRYVICDQSQFEIRIIADRTGDAALIKAYMDGADLHQVTMDLCGIDDRTVAKNLNFGAFYDIGEVKFAHMLTIKTGKYVPDEKAEEWLDLFFKVYAGVPKYKLRLVETARKSGCQVLTYLGRRRRLPDLLSPDRWLRQRAERQAFNAQIQGGVADCMTVCMLRADRCPLLKKWGVYMVGQVHDEVHFIVSRKVDYAKVMSRLQEIFEHPFKKSLRVPLKFSSNGHYCLSWHEGK